MQERNKFSEALHYYKLAIGSRPTLACKYRSSSSPSSFIYNLPPLWLWLCCVQATAGSGRGGGGQSLLTLKHSCVTSNSVMSLITIQATTLSFLLSLLSPVLLSVCSSFSFFLKLLLWIHHTVLPFLTLNYLQTAASSQTASLHHSDKSLYRLPQSRIELASGCSEHRSKTDPECRSFNSTN